MTLKNNLLTATTIDEGWDLRTAVLPESLNVGTTATGIWFKPDGTRLYTVSSSTITQYNLSTPWNVNTATSAGSFTYGTGTNIGGLYFNDAGTVVYFTRQITTNSEVRSLVLTTAWDITTANDVGAGAAVYIVGDNETAPQTVFLKPDGTKMYVMGSLGDDVNEYNLSTPWNVSTASFVQAFSVAGKETAPYGLFFKPDGTKMYVSGPSSDSIHEYNLSTAWNVSTASFSQSLSLGFGYTFLRHIYFNADGTKVYFYDSTTASLTSGTLSTAWNISTISLSNTTFYVGTQETAPAALFFKPDGTKMYVMGSTGDDVNEYNLSVAWDISTATYVQIFYIGGLEATPTGLFFKTDGTKMYVLGSSGDDINEYNLSTPWDISTATYLRVSVVLSDTGPQGLFFNSDGTRMYVIGAGSDNVYQYDVLSAWNVGTISYVRALGIGLQEINPTSLFFKPDGTRMYLAGSTSDNVVQYNLSTPWNISTATLDFSINIADLDGASQDIFFKPDGTKLYLLGSTNDRISTINL